MRLTKRSYLTLAIILSLLALLHQPQAVAASQTETFRYHMTDEPHSLDPARNSVSDAAYFFPQLMRGLYTYSNAKGLVPEGAKRCSVQGLKISCELASKKWSDGSAVVADDYVRAFRHLLGKDSKNSALQLLSNLKNAIDVSSGKKPAADLGVASQGANKLVFTLQEPDPDFLFKLTSPLFVPIKSEKFPERDKASEIITNGPYKISEWSRGRRIRLVPDPQFDADAKKRPNIEILFIEDEDTALNLYDSGELTFLRRLPTTHIPKRRGTPEYHDVAMARFDYFGFGPEFKDQPAFREALSYSLNFPELQKIFDSPGVPGCSNLPMEYMGEEICLKFDLKRAQAAWAKVPENVKNKRYTFVFSKLGGDDHKKAGEWLQNQWRKNLGLKIDLEFAEQGVFLHSLKTKTPALFRKGVSLDRPTCLAGLENFGRGNPENYVRLDDKNFETILEKLGQPQTKGRPEQKLCAQGVRILLDQNRIVPTGRFYFAVLAKPQFKGWSINEMNQFDLIGLRK